MRKRKVRFLALLMATVMAVTIGAWAAPSSTDIANADTLHSLGLFQGTTSGYALDKTATRHQGLIMLIRLLGEESEAMAYTEGNPFKDVPAASVNETAKYISYGYHMGYTTGTTTTTFSPGNIISFKSYVTFLLRALGYTNQSWDTALTVAVQIGLMDSASAATIEKTTPTFYRADLVNLSLCALTMKTQGGSQTLAQKLVQDGVFTQAQGEAAGVLGGTKTFTYQVRDESTISRTTNTYTVASGKVKADVVTVNTANSRVSIKSAMVTNTLGATGAFSNIVANSSASVVINGNFFEAYNNYKFPIGHVMVNGQFLYGVSGLTAFGFTSDGEIRVGRPSVFFYVRGAGCTWACYECNARAQDNSNSVLYNRAYGTSVKFTHAGVATTVSNGVITATQSVSSGSSLDIPADGYVMYFGPGFAATDYYQTPVVGTAVTMTPELTKTDANGFTLDGLESIVSGAPRLVEAGKICTTLEAGFQEERFTTQSTARTAIGKLSNGKLVIVSTASATIQQLRELMMQLGCVDAVNLDGGASTALAYNKQVIRSPGRQLTTTLQIFVG